MINLRAAAHYSTTVNLGTAVSYNCQPRTVHVSTIVNLGAAVHVSTETIMCILAYKQSRILLKNAMQALQFNTMKIKCCTILLSVLWYYSVRNENVQRIQFCVIWFRTVQHNVVQYWKN